MAEREIGRTDKAEIVLVVRPEGTAYELNLMEAAYLAVLLDEAIEAAKGRAVKLDEG
jgi:hypothetical protein